uniref:GMP synthase (glutamine-hydrolyzing) n=1 Tax=Acrobeloides nanus TaxID=290746 RepID=A0A914DWN0_9BILA
MSGMENAIEQKVAILDFGAQFSKVIDRRVRENNIYSVILPLNTSAAEIKAAGYKAVIVSGGPNSVYAPNAPKYDPAIFQLDVPILGICYGFQLINKEFGGSVSSGQIREDGQTEILVDTSCKLFDGLKQEQLVLLTHGDSVTKSSVAPGFRVAGSSGDHVSVIANESRRIYGVQFHPEVDLTENGHQMFSNFLKKIVGLDGSYTMINRELMCIDEIKQTVGDKKVLVMVSGGVDSAVCAALLNRALGADRVVAIHIDTGFMRLNESSKVMDSLQANGLKVYRYNYIDKFLNARLELPSSNPEEVHVATPPLKFTTLPEHKRMIIGDTFIRCKDIVMKELNLSTDMFFAQGTLRPDLIESASELASGHADVIKTHHNDTALVRELRSLGKVIEPLKDFHKDEVRELGATLGLPEEIVHRHPFPGPGLAIRIICATEPFIEESFQSTEHLLNEIIDEFNKKFRTAIVSTLLPIKSVGVQGDCRSYSYVVALSTDLPKIPWDVLEKIAKTIPSRCHNINRVAFAFGGAIKQPVRDITKTYVNEGTLYSLRQADHIVESILRASDPKTGQPLVHLKPAMNCIQQMPVVMLPIHFDRQFTAPQSFPSICHSYCLRPFITRDFMTGKAAIPGKDINELVILEMAERIKRDVPSTSRVLIDLTSKPPGTTEWE